MEVRVHTEAATAPTDHVIVPLRLDESLVVELEASTLPLEWRRYPQVGEVELGEPVPVQYDPRLFG
ncbi:MAG: hypothetical protein KDA24_23080 [Deltaproteobacteria bacterium]|nr:hypothetical protein [Deltaproteobacteria bacterium]